MHQTLVTGSLSHITHGPNLQALSGHAVYSLAGWQMPIRHVSTLQLLQTQGISTMQTQS